MDRRYAGLVQEQADLRQEGERIAAAAETENRAFTEQEEERYAAIAARLGQLTSLIASADVMREERRALADQAMPTVPGGSVVVESKPVRPFASLGEQLLAVIESSQSGARTHKGLLEIQAAATGLNEIVPSDGGFLIQPDFTTDLLRDMYDTGVLAAKTRRRPVSGSGFRGNAVDETSRADGSRMGGIQAYWTSEAGALTGSRPKFRRVALDLEKLTGLYYATDELLQDAASLQAEVGDWFTEEFGFKVDDGIIRGLGNGMPLGILNSPALVSQAAEGGQTAATVNALNVQKMFARMKPRSLRNAEWFLNQEVWPQLFAMNQANMPIFLPGGNLSTAPFGMLLGRPINPIEQASALGAVGDIMFLDLNQYLLIEKGGIRADSSIHVAFLTDETAFRFILRLNGQPVPISPITPFKGSSTLSPFVALAAR